MVERNRLARGILACLASPVYAAFASDTVPLRKPYSIERVYARAVDPPKALSKNATSDDLRWQPSMDFDTDSCYNVPAIDADGNVAEGLEHNNVGLSEDCHDLSDLENNNVYSRQRCNNGWCAYLYSYYFEKDVALENFPLDPGHRHDFEHIGVWVKDDKVEYVAASAHGGFDIKAASEVRFDGEHPKMVYHKDGISTHAFRFGNEDDEDVENDLHEWFRGDLVSWNGFPGDIRQILSDHDFGDANFDLKDGKFESALERAKPEDITFDVDIDDGSPGTP